MASIAPLLPWERGDIDDLDESLLVTEDDAPLNNILTEKQKRLLSEPLYSSWSGPPPAEDGAPRPFGVMANVGLFSTLDEPPVVPDLMLSLDVTIPQDLGEKRHRSYFLWRYGKPPEVVIEIVSNRKGSELGVRRARYARMRVDHYVVYDPLNEIGDVTLRAFTLSEGVYVETLRPWFANVGLGLVEWEGTFEGLHRRWLRWCTRDGNIVPTGAVRAESAETRAQAAEARAQRLAARLRDLGIEPDGER